MDTIDTNALIGDALNIGTTLAFGTSAPTATAAPTIVPAPTTAASSTPTWLLPVLLIGGGLVAVFALLSALRK